MCWGIEEAKAAKIAVWWDMNYCPIPEGYDARRIRQRLEGAFKKLGYSGPVSITAYGDQTQTPGHLLQGLSSTGVAVTHTISESTVSLMYEDMVEWRGHNPPPATMMIISDQVMMRDDFSLDLVRLQQRTCYNLFLAYSSNHETYSLLLASAEWRWEKLLNNKLETRSAPLPQEKCSEPGELSAMFCCRSCNFDCQSLENFKEHLSSYRHGREEVINPTYKNIVCVTKTWGRNYAATPEYATAKIQVYWDMFDCPIPDGYDARRVRPSIERAFMELGYSGSVSITAYGDQKHIPDPLLQALSSTGVDVAHTVADRIYTHMGSDWDEWTDHNPPPATLMFISDNVEEVLSCGLVDLLQEQKYNLFMGYSFRPYKMSALLTSAEWLWESLLAVSKTRRHVLQRCSESERGLSTGKFCCKLCDFDCKKVNNFRRHLSSKEHAGEENYITEFLKVNKRDHRQSRVAQYNRENKRARKMSKQQTNEENNLDGFSADGSSSYGSSSDEFLSGSSSDELLSS